MRVKAADPGAAERLEPRGEGIGCEGQGAHVGPGGGRGGRGGQEKPSGRRAPLSGPADDKHSVVKPTVPVARAPEGLSCGWGGHQEEKGEREGPRFLPRHQDT